MFTLFFLFTLFSISYCFRCLEITGADGVMSSEGLLGNPRMFSEEGNRMFFEDFARSQLQTADDFLKILQSHKLPRPLYQVVRSHLFKILYRFTDAPKNNDIRRQLADGDFEQMKNVVVKIHEKMNAINYDTDKGVAEGLIGTTHWYYRHRDEKASNRINSIPRKKRSVIDLKSSVGGTTSTSNTATSSSTSTSTDDISTKLSLLKLKLSERKLSSTLPISGNDNENNGNGDMPVKNTYASFMAKKELNQ